MYTAQEGEGEGEGQRDRYKHLETILNHYTYNTTMYYPDVDTSTRWAGACEVHLAVRRLAEILGSRSGDGVRYLQRPNMQYRACAGHSIIRSFVRARVRVRLFFASLFACS